MEELYEKKDILLDNEYIQTIILEKYEELLQENDMLREEVQNLKYQLRERKKRKKPNKESSPESEQTKPCQLMFDFDFTAGSTEGV